MSSRAQSPMRGYRQRKDAVRKSVLDCYYIMGFLASGTYGRVYKARAKRDSNGEPTSDGELAAIKKFKPDKDGEQLAYTGISQSACREIMLNRELHHANLAGLREVMLEDKSIYLIFEYAEHDFLQMIHHHTTTRTNIPTPVLKSMLWQLLNGVAYLHDNWVIHRDLKPANILVTSKGEVKIGDLGLARIYASPLQSLYASDKVVVTIWYRPPDLLMGARHYTTSVDIWSVGCIFGELVGLRPMFKGEEAKLEAPTATNTGGHKKSSVPFQRDQLTRIFEVLGVPTRQRWPKVSLMPDHERLDEFPNYPNELQKWWTSRAGRHASQQGFDMLSALLAYDPEKRITAHQALLHPWWEEDPKVTKESFPANVYPLRRVSHDDSDPKLNAAAAKDSGKAGTNTAGSGFNVTRPNKKARVS